MAAAVLAPFGTRAQSFPSRTLTLVVPYPAGGPADVMARLMEPLMRKALGQSFIVDNVAGVGGSLGIQKLLAAPADGHTLMMGTPSDVILAPLALAAVKHRPEQLRLVGLASQAPLMLVGGMRLEARTVAELLAAARRLGAKGYSYGSIGLGSLYHLVGEDFAARQQITMTHVPYKGVAPLVQDLIGGQVDLAFLPSAGNTTDLVSQGKLRAYAVTDAKRLARLPEVPTMAEVAGLKDFDYEIWGGLFVPRDVPAAGQQRLNGAINDALQDPEFRRQVEASGSSVARALRCRNSSSTCRHRPQDTAASRTFSSSNRSSPSDRRQGRSGGWGRSTRPRRLGPCRLATDSVRMLTLVQPSRLRGNPAWSRRVASQPLRPSAIRTSTHRLLRLSNWRGTVDVGH